MQIAMPPIAVVSQLADKRFICILFATLKHIYKLPEHKNDHTDIIGTASRAHDLTANVIMRTR